MHRFLSLAVGTALVLASNLLHAQTEITAAEAPTQAEAGAEPVADPSVAQKLELKGTPFTVDEDGDYEILVDVGDERSQLVWVRSAVNETDQQRVREIWTYGLRSEERRIPAHIANRLLSANFELIVGSWARHDGNAILIMRIDADASADTLDEAIDLAAAVGDSMEQRLGTGDDL